MSILRSIDHGYLADLMWATGLLLWLVLGFVGITFALIGAIHIVVERWQERRFSKEIHSFLWDRPVLFDQDAPR